jgi:hypothetical protein
MSCWDTTVEEEEVAQTQTQTQPTAPTPTPEFKSGVDLPFGSVLPVGAVVILTPTSEQSLVTAVKEYFNAGANAVGMFGDCLWIGATPDPTSSVGQYFAVTDNGNGSFTLKAE